MKINLKKGVSFYKIGWKGEFFLYKTGLRGEFFLKGGVFSKSEAPGTRIFRCQVPAPGKELGEEDHFKQSTFSNIR